MTRLVSLALVSVFAAACGDNHSAPDAAGLVGDAATTDATAGTDHPFGVVVAGSFTAGSPGVLSLVNPLTLDVRPNAIAGAVGDDPVVRKINGNLYVVNRADTSNVTTINAATLAVSSQVSTGASSNPQDIAVVGSKLYVPALGTAGVVVIDTSATPATVTTISLASLDLDGKPDCVSAYAVGTQVYVACGLLDATSTPRGPGVVAVIDATTDSFKPALTVTLPAANPQGFFVATPTDSMFGGDLLIATVPSFSTYTTGCLARVTPGTAPAAHGCAINNSDLAGYVSHAEVQELADGSETLWMAVDSYSSDFSMSFGKLRSYDLKAGTLAAAISPASEVIDDVAACTNGSVIVSDHATASGIRVYKGGVEVSTAPLAVGLPPTFGNSLTCYDNDK